MGNTCSNKKSTNVQEKKVKSEVKAKVNTPEKETKVDSLAGRPPWNPSIVVDPPPRKRRELEDDPTYAPSAQKDTAKDQKEKPGSPEEDSVTKEKISPEEASKCCSC
ncbi:hypothetical protein R1sor_009453 [Riccia sorocarpa]|uniref:Uncharacterized protein n=1 Tax=Riccia sorocarpa TaxID=122646 RepID=A0ABD3HXW1_9MARC